MYFLFGHVDALDVPSIGGKGIGQCFEATLLMMMIHTQWPVTGCGSEENAN